MTDETVRVRLLLVAPPGSGKGTQAARLAEHFGIETISTGDLLRREVAAGTALGRQVKGYVDRGDLVPDLLLRDVVAARLSAADGRGGFLLDGYPRTLAQAEDARAWARANGVSLDGVVHLDVGRDELLRRLLGRAASESRSDDREATIRHRLEVFDHQTAPLLDYYRDRGLLITVDGDQAVDRVTRDILDKLAAARAGGA